MPDRMPDKMSNRMSNYMLDKLLVRGDHTKKSFAFAHCCFDHPRLGGQQRQKTLWTVKNKTTPQFPNSNMEPEKWGPR